VTVPALHFSNRIKIKVRFNTRKRVIEQIIILTTGYWQAHIDSLREG
jgi:hypothetical protein